MDKLLSQIRKTRTNIIPDLMDHLEREAPPTFERTIHAPQDGEKALGLLCPPELREKIMRLTERFENGTYRARIIAGSKEKETSHPHDFFIEKDAGGIALLFLDPEHHIGTRSSRRSWVDNMKKFESTLRPPVGNLMMLKMPTHAVPEIAITRYRTEGVAAFDKRVVTNMEAQYQAAQQLIAKDGIPDFLSAHKKDILFRVLVTEKVMLLQARGGGERDAQAFFEGGVSNALIKGKVDSQKALLARFERLLEEGRFEKL
jgi:hypothetical protein